MCSSDLNNSPPAGNYFVGADLNIQGFGNSSGMTASFFVQGNVKITGNGTFTPNYNVAIFDGVIYKGGKAAPLSAYLMYDRRLLKRQVTFRLGIQNAYDLLNGNSPYRITGATSFNATTLKPNYIYRYADPTTWSLSINTRL